MNKDDTKQAIIGFMEFTKGITGNKDLKIPEDIAKEYGIEQDDTVVQPTYEERLNTEREKIAEDVADKMAYMGSCLNERNIILGIITGKRETLDSLCSICKSESCVSNGTAISKTDYEARLKADMVDILGQIRTEIEWLRLHKAEFLTSNNKVCIDSQEVLDIIDKYREEIKE